MENEDLGKDWHKNDNSKNVKNILVVTHGSFITEFINAIFEEFSG